MKILLTTLAITLAGYAVLGGRLKRAVADYYEQIAFIGQGQ